MDRNKLLAEELADSVQIVDGAMKARRDVAGAKDTLGVAEALVQKEEVMAAPFLHLRGTL